MASADPNAAQIEFWNGTVGSNWAAAHERMDTLLEPLTQVLMRKAYPVSDETVLDVGCGCGGTSLLLATTGARVIGVDISEPMLAVARTRSKGRSSPTFLLADAASYAFEEPFDLVFSRFGVMFFADPVAAFRNLHQATKPTGRLCFVCWQSPADNPWIALPMAAAQPLLPETEPVDPKAPGPFAFADAEYTSAILADAGFADVTVEPLAVTLTLGEDLDEALDFYTEIGPLARALEELDGESVAKVRAAVRAALADQTGEQTGPLSLPGNCWIVSARRAG